MNVLIRWETGQVTPVPLTQFLADCPYELAMFAIENDLLEKPLWKKCKRFARRRTTFKAKGGNKGNNIKFITRKINQAKINSFRTAPKYKYRYKVPKDYND